MTVNRLLTFSAAALAVLLASTSVSASTTPYGSYFGANPGQVDFVNVEEDHNVSPTPRFNAPTRINNRLVFNNPTFVSTSTGGASEAITSLVRMTINADMGHFLGWIIFRERGTYQFTGEGTAASTASVSGQLTVISPPDCAFPQCIVPLQITPQPIYTLTGDGPSGSFSGYAAVDLTPYNLTTALVSFSNDLLTSSEQGTTSIIRKSKIRLEAPEPASALLLLAGATLLLRRRSHRPHYGNCHFNGR